MATYITGSSNYPYNLDLLPTGVGTNPTIAYVLDEIRDTNGVVTQSGTPITAVQMNATYTIIDKIEGVLGYNPEGTYTDVASRLNDMQFSGSNAFLHLSGGSITGPVDFISGSTLNVTTLNGNSLSMTLSGTTNINASGNINIGSTGNISMIVSNLYLTGIGVTVEGTNIAVNGGTTTTLTADGNIISMTSTDTTLNKDVVPLVSSTIYLGSPIDTFAGIFVDQVVATGLSSIAGYVATSGSSIDGVITFTGTSGLVLDSGSHITFVGSGVNNIGSLDNPLSGLYTKNLYATNVSGMSPINFYSNINMIEGTSIITSGTGVMIGSLANPIDTIYATNIIGATGLDATQIVQRSGSDMFGNLSITGTASLVMGSGSNIVMETSGSSNIGSSGSYVNNIYTNSINERPLGTMVFNELLTGTTDGVNRTFFFSHEPASGYAMVFVSGTYMRPGVDFMFSGTAIVLTGTTFAPTTSPYAGFYVY